MIKITLATLNKHKSLEFAQLLKMPTLNLLDLSDVNPMPSWIESGDTFLKNAEIKAREVAKHVKGLVLADDSGLCVEALGGKPGVYSARLAGENASDEENNLMLLRNLKNSENRSAYYYCCLVLLFPNDKIQIFEGRCDGEILLAPQGKEGFGYDPLFYIPRLKKSMAELSSSEKNQISHRALAVESLKKFLINL